jgi:hypothetical protein
MVPQHFELGPVVSSQETRVPGRAQEVLNLHRRSSHLGRQAEAFGCGPFVGDPVNRQRQLMTGLPDPKSFGGRHPEKLGHSTETAYPFLGSG